MSNKYAQITLGALSTADIKRQSKASMCKVELINTFHDIEEVGLLERIKNFFLGKNLIKIYHITFKFRVTSDTGSIHNVFIRIKPDFDLNNWVGNPTQVFCDCDDFKYRCAYDLNQYKSLFINDNVKMKLGASITQAPKKIGTAPVCKHVLAAVNWLINNYQNIMQTI